MQDIQDIFNRVQETKKEIRGIRNTYKELLASTGGYQELVEKLNGYKLQKKNIEHSVEEQMSSEFDKLERFKSSLASDQVLLSDAALSQYLKGQSIKITDERNSEYEPVFSVKFKKSGTG